MRHRVFTVIAVVAFAVPARADLTLTVVDNPTGGGSWWQSFVITDGTFDRVTIGGVKPNSQRPWRVENVVRDSAGDLTIVSDGGPGFGSVADIRGTNMASLAFDMHFADTFEESSCCSMQPCGITRRYITNGVTFPPHGRGRLEEREWSVWDFCMDLDPAGRAGADTRRGSAGYARSGGRGSEAPPDVLRACWDARVRRLSSTREVTGGASPPCFPGACHTGRDDDEE